MELPKTCFCPLCGSTIDAISDPLLPHYQYGRCTFCDCGMEWTFMLDPHEMSVTVVGVKALSIPS